MKKIIITFFSLFFAVALIIGIINYKEKNKKIEEDYHEETAQIIENQSKEENETIIINIEKKAEKEERVENKKDAATLTQEIYNINGPIGRLYIPKTGLNTEIYSNVTVDKMEEMPCFLYTTGGLNKIGTTLLVGHNRMNGKLFSDNDELEEGDEFYFKDIEGKELKYIVYSKTIKIDGDISFVREEVNNPTIALSCCTDNNDDYRIVILAKSEEI